MKDLAERFAELRNAIMRLPGNPSCDDRARLRHQLLHLEHTMMSARGSLDDAVIAIMDAEDAALTLTSRAALAGQIVPPVAVVRCPRTLRAASTNVQESLRKAKRRATRPREERVPTGRCLNPINRRCQMFDSRPASTESNDTLFNPGSTSDADPGFAAPLPDAGALLAAAGLPAHAIREVLGSRTYTGADG